jgi:hypothetical protein
MHKRVKAVGYSKGGNNSAYRACSAGCTDCALARVLACVNAVEGAEEDGGVRSNNTCVPRVIWHTAKREASSTHRHTEGEKMIRQSHARFHFRKWRVLERLQKKLRCYDPQHVRSPSGLHSTTRRCFH